MVKPGYTLCFAAKWLGEDDVTFRSIYHDTRKKMLKSAYSLIEDADSVVTFNGRKFDIPTLNKEFVKEGMGPPAPHRDIDLYVTAKKKFRFASNKLDFVSQFLGLDAKVEHKGMELWTGCMNRDEECWDLMRAYNVNDVTMMEPLYYRLLPWIHGHPNVALHEMTTEPACPTCGSHNLQRRGYYYTNTMRYARIKCNDCGRWSRERTNDLHKDEKPNILSAI